WLDPRRPAGAALSHVDRRGRAGTARSGARRRPVQHSRRGLGLLDPQPVPRRVADSRVADAPRLAGGLREHLDPGRLGDLGERSVEVVDAEMDRIELTLGELGGDRVAVLLRAAGMWLGEHDADLGLALGDERDPAEPALFDLELHAQ